MSNRTINETIDSMIGLVRAIAFCEPHTEPEPVEVGYLEYVAERFVIMSFSIAVICRYGFVFGVGEEDGVYYTVDEAEVAKHDDTGVDLLVARLGCAYRNQDTEQFSDLLETADEDRVMEVHRWLICEAARLLHDEGPSVDLSHMRFPTEITYDDYLLLGEQQNAARWN